MDSAPSRLSSYPSATHSLFRVLVEGEEESCSKNGEPDRPACSERTRNKPSESSREDRAIESSKIYQNGYWKEQCFGLTVETLVDKAMEFDHFGGTYGGAHRRTPFLCLILKMLQIQPDKDIVVEFIKNEDYKYVRVLMAFYLCLTGTVADVYQYLEPLYNDYRKLTSLFWLHLYR